jgi:hypothetical protein
MPMECDLIAPHTLLEATANGESLDVSASPTRTFLCTLVISNQIEQESLDVSIWGSADGQSWGTHPILKVPQRFYRGETRAILDLAHRPEVKFIRAKWEVNKWGRGAPSPSFHAGLHLAEIPAMPQAPALQPIS